MTCTWSDAAVRAAIAAHFGATNARPHGDLMARMRRALDAAEQRRRTEHDARPYLAEVSAPDREVEPVGGESR